MPSLDLFLNSKFRPPCIVCGVPCSHIGMWEPSDKMNPLFGTQKGRVKHLVYGVCEKHFPENGDYPYDDLEKFLIRTFIENKEKVIHIKEEE